MSKEYGNIRLPLLRDIEMSAGLRAVIMANEWNQFEEVLEHSHTELTETYGFDYHLLKEWYEILESLGLASYFKES